MHVDIETLVDIREVPLSRKRGFSKTALGKLLAANGLRYVHLKGLGDPKEGREAARTGAFDVFRGIFDAHMETAAAQTDLAEAARLIEGSASCLLCFERNPKQCHRTIVADHLMALTGFERQNLGVRKGQAEEYGTIRYPDEQSTV